MLWVYWTGIGRFFEKCNGKRVDGCTFSSSEAFNVLTQVSPPKKQTETAAPHAFTAAAATTYDEKKLVKSPSNAAGVVREGKGGAAIVASTDEMRYNATPEKNGLDGMDDSRGEETGADGAMEGTRGGEGQMVNKAEWNPEKLGYTVLFNPGFENS